MRFLLLLPFIACCAVPGARAAAFPSLSPPAPATALPSFDPEKIIKNFWEKAEYSGGASFYFEGERIIPGLFFSLRRDGSFFYFAVSRGDSPFIKDRYSFLRENGIPVKRTYSSVTLGGSTVTYSNDEISAFESRTLFTDAAFVGTLYSAGDFLFFRHMEGITAANNRHKINCVLDDNSAYSESDSVWGGGIFLGLSAAFGGEILVNRGVFAEMGILYRRIWFFEHSGKAGAAILDKVSGLRGFLRLGWMF